MNIDGVYLNNFRFADDIILISTSAEELQEMIQELADASSQIGLEMNVSKTKIMSPDKPNIRIGNQQTENVGDYIYLGYQIKLGKENQGAEIDRRIRLGWAAFGKLDFILKSLSIPINLEKTDLQCMCASRVRDRNDGAARK